MQLDVQFAHPFTADLDLHPDGHVDEVSKHLLTLRSIVTPNLIVNGKKITYFQFACKYVDFPQLCH